MPGIPPSVRYKGVCAKKIVSSNMAAPFSSILHDACPLSRAGPCTMQVKFTPLPSDTHLFYHQLKSEQRSSPFHQ